MKKLLALILFSALLITPCIAQTWLWAKEANVSYNTGSNEGYGIASDKFHNAYLTGIFAYTVVYGTYTLTNSGNEDMFLVKYDANGNVVWAKQSVVPSNSNSVFGEAITVDKFNNICATGYFFGTASFGSYNLISNPSQSNMYVVKYDNSGNVLWATQVSLTGNSLVQGLAITTDSSGSIYVTGDFNGSIDFGTTKLTYAPLYGDYDFFIVKYNSSGNVVWARQAIASSGLVNAGGLGIASDKNCNIYVTGDFGDTVSFGSFTLGTFENGAFVVKYDSSGTVLWANQATCLFGTAGNAITADNSNNIYVTGYFADTLSLGTQTLVDPAWDVFILKYNSAGKLLWAKNSKSFDSATWVGYTIATDTIGHIYLSLGATISGNNQGNYKTVVYPDTFKVYNNSMYDGVSVIVKMDSSGKALCGSILAGGGDDYNGITVDGSGNYVFFGGDVWENTVIGKDTLTASFNTEPSFLSRWQPCGVTEGINEITPSNQELAILYPNPNNGRFDIHLITNPNLTGNKLLEVYNIMGESIYNQRINTSNSQVDLINATTGLYLYRIITETGNTISEGKFIIQK